MDARQTFSEPYMRYVVAIQQAIAHPDLNARAAGGYAEYVKVAMETLQHTDQTRLREAYEGYLKAVQEAVSPSTVQKRAHEAFGTYMRAIHDAWAKVDPASLDPASLAAIAEILFAGAWLAYITGGASKPAAATTT